MKVLVIQAWKRLGPQGHICCDQLKLLLGPGFQLHEVSLDNFSVDSLQGIDVVLVDARATMAVPRLRDALGNDVRVILMSDHSTAEDIAYGYQLGATRMVRRSAREVKQALDELTVDEEDAWGEGDSAPFVQNVNVRTDQLQRLARELEMYVISDHIQD